jgi:hypothetical protein
MEEPSHRPQHPLTVAAVPGPAPVKPPERRQLERRRPRRAAAWASKDVLRAALLVFALYFGLQLLWEVHPLILTAFVGLLFGLGVARGADHLERLHVPRGVSAGVLVLATYAALFGVMAIAAPTLQKQFGELRQRLPEALDRVDQWVAANRGSFWGQILDSSSTQEGQPAQAAPQTSLPPPTPALFGSGGRRGGRAAAAAAGQAAAGQPATTGPSTTGGMRAGGAAVPGGARRQRRRGRRVRRFRGPPLSRGPLRPRGSRRRCVSA